jgi:hypothetical protein
MLIHHGESKLKSTLWQILPASDISGLQLKFVKVQLMQLFLAAI